MGKFLPIPLVLTRDPLQIVPMKVHCPHDKMVPIGEMVPNPKNPNVHSDDQIERLAKILEYQGWRYPIKVCKQSGFITSGHGRLLAATKLGLKKVPVSFQDYDSEEQMYADLVSDNAIASWAELKLADINIEIPNLGPDFDIDLLGIKNFKIDLAENEGLTDPDAIPENAETRVKPGDIWILGNHRLMCGDSTSPTDLEKLMDGELADLVFTDPPYGVDYDGGHAQKGKRREKLANDDSTEIYAGSVPMMAAFSKPKSALYLWFSDTKALRVLQVLQDNEYQTRSWIIWNKNVAQFGAIGAQYKQKHEPCLYAFKSGESPFWDGPNNEVSVWDVKRSSKNEFHPTQKPTELAQRAFGNSCPNGGIVLDLFGGSGSTLIAAEQSGRMAYCMELEPKYCDVILTRWEKFTGKAAVLQK